MSPFSRRHFLRSAALSAAGVSFSGWMPRLARSAADVPARPRQCVLLWMPGGPSQMDTFDLKPGHANGGPFKEIATSVPGLKISEHLPKLAAMVENLAIVRSLSTAEGDHNRGTYLMHTGHKPGGPISFPTMGSTISKALGADEAELPNFISIAPQTALSSAAYGPGFLGPRHGPLTVGGSSPIPVQPATGGLAALGVDDLQNPSVNRQQEDARLELWRMLQSDFLATHSSASPRAQNTVYERAVRMMRSAAAQAFELSGESDKVRNAYGRGQFGQGCLMARRLIERGVPFIEIALRGSGGVQGWDTHQQNFDRVKTLSAELEAGWATLMTELRQRGLWESTTILWLGEFGRTPTINPSGGRDHFPRAWTTVLAGGGIQGGQAYGRTSADGSSVEENQVDVPDVLATLCRSLGIDPHTQNISDLGRPIKIAEGKPIEALLA
jgi:hypothetical protein